MGSLWCFQSSVGACSCSSSSSRDGRNAERTRKPEQQQTLHCLVTFICCWNEEQCSRWRHLPHSVHWSYLGKFTISLLCLWEQQTGTSWVLPMDPAQSSAGHSCYTLQRDRLGTGTFQSTWSFTLHLLQGNWDPSRSYSFLPPCRKASSSGNVPSQLESKATEHISPDSMEHLHFTDD